MSGSSEIPEASAAALRSLPAVEAVLEAPAAAEAIRTFGRELFTESVRDTLDAVRRSLLAGGAISHDAISVEGVASAAALLAEKTSLPNLTSIINATGVVLHTNLGRAVLPPEAIEAVERISASYSNLEYDLAAGRRGSRHDHITSLIVALTGAEDALVVNNNAAAVLLALTTFARGKEVVVSRGQLIEIGGSFRIPDVLAASTARLAEVGTTNKTKLGDYEGAIGPETAMLLHVHTSNYKVVGFTAEVGISELAQLGHDRGLVVVDDLGSGALAELPALADEPSVHDSLAAGADIVTFSGDKLLGGPQAGIVVGKSEFVRKMKQHPMARALRVDKMTLAALQATLAIYLKPEQVLERIPTLRMLSESEESLKARAEAMAAAIGSAVGNAATLKIDVEPAASKVGGGALPLLELSSYVCAITPAAVSVDELAERLRHTKPPVIGRIHHDRLLLDARTVLPEQVDALANAVSQALAGAEVTGPEG